MKPINKVLLFSILLLTALLTCISFLSFAANEEGTLKKDSILQIFVTLFTVLRFPFHTTLWDLISKFGAIAYFATLFLNCIFYSFIIERAISFLKRK